MLLSCFRIRVNTGTGIRGWVSLTDDNGTTLVEELLADARSSTPQPMAEHAEFINPSAEAAIAGESALMMAGDDTIATSEFVTDDIDNSMV